MRRARLYLIGTFSVFVKLNATHQRNVVWYYFKNQTNLFSYNQFFFIVKPLLVEELSYFVKIKPIKFNFKIEPTNRIPNAEISSKTITFKRSARTVFAYKNVKKNVEDIFAVLMDEQGANAGKGSGFTLEYIDGLLLRIYQYTLRGGFLYSHIVRHCR